MRQIQLSFDPVLHKYTDEEDNVYTSVTTLIGLVTRPYEVRYWSMYRALEESGYRLRPDDLKYNKERISIYDKKQLLNPWVSYHLDQLYTGVVHTNRTVSAITDDWETMADIACDWGNERHNYLEDCTNDFYGERAGHEAGTVADLSGYDVKRSPFKYKIKTVAELDNNPLKKSHLSIYTLLVDLINKGFILYAEKRVYTYEHRISGTIDILAVRGNEFYIVDWKTNKDEIRFESGYYKKVWDEKHEFKIKTNEWIKTDDRYLQPIDHLQVCKGNGYTLQLSLYAYLVELWGFKCLGLILCHIRHKEKLERTNYRMLNNGKVSNLLVTKKETKPRIYRNISYLRKEAADLVNWHKAIKIDGIATDSYFRSKLLRKSTNHS